MKLLIFLIAIYLPFEDFIIKWLPNNYILYAKQVSDMLLFVMYLVIFINVISKLKFKVPSKFIFFSFIFFVIYIILLAIINQNNLFYSFIQIKALVRYIPIIFVIFLIKNINYNFSHNLFKVLIGIGTIESILGIFQYHFQSIKNFFRFKETPEVSGFVINYSSLFDVKDVFGTMAHTINYAYFLLISLSILLFMNNVIKSSHLKWFLISLHMIAIYYSGSRGAFICGIITIIIGIYLNRNLISLSLYSFAFAISPIAVFLIDKGESDKDFWFFLNPQYIETLRNQRLGIIEDIFLNFIKTKEFLFGLGPDHYLISSFLTSRFSINLPIQFTHRAIEDVYWVALFVYYGVIGMVLFGIFFSSLIANIKYHAFTLKSYNYIFRHGLLCLWLIFISFMFNFISQVYEVKTFSFYLWLFIGLFLNNVRKYKYVRANRFSIS